MIVAARTCSQANLGNVYRRRDGGPWCQQVAYVLVTVKAGGEVLSWNQGCQMYRLVQGMPGMAGLEWVV
jgi:hypothetical protein